MLLNTKFYINLFTKSPNNSLSFSLEITCKQVWWLKLLDFGGKGTNYIMVNLIFYAHRKSGLKR